MASRFAPPTRPMEPVSRQAVAQDGLYLDPWAITILNGLKQGDGYLILVNSETSATSDYRRLDDQLAQIAVLQSQITCKTDAGKEINALKNSVGFPPFTFSEVEIFYPGSTISLAQHWESEGMPTLIPGLSIFPPLDNDERRSAVLFGVGDFQQLENLEKAFLEIFTPSYYEKGFSDTTNLKTVPSYGAKFFVQWELFDNEAAQALGVSKDSDEFKAIMGQLENQTRALWEITEAPSNPGNSAKNTHHHSSNTKKS